MQGHIGVVAQGAYSLQVHDYLAIVFVQPDLDSLARQYKINHPCNTSFISNELLELLALLLTDIVEAVHRLLLGREESHLLFLCLLFGGLHLR